MKEDELKEIFLAEALEGYEELNKLFTILEKDHADKRSIDAIFRITHTLKANAAGMGYQDIAEMAHTLEDIFSEIRIEKLKIEGDMFNDLFRANDIFGAMLDRLSKPNLPAVKYKGIKTKLEVLIREARKGFGAIPEAKVSKSKTENTVTNIEATTIIPDEPANQPSNDIENTHAAHVLLTASASKVEAEVLEMEESIIEDADIHYDKEVEAKVSFSDLVQIPVRKLDNLMNLVGELIIERDRVTTLINSTTRTNEFSRLQRITSELQYSVMDVRLVQVHVLFNKFHRIVRDTAAIENKKVNLILKGTENEIDRNVLQIISDSLVHLVRNAISHGVESPKERVKNGKSEIGNVIIRAKSEKDEVIIEVEDDGKGIDYEVIKRKAIEKGIITVDFAKLMSEDDIVNLIFEAGFSSVEQITAVSGRGVGMDVVKKSIDSIGGKVTINTVKGKGSIFSLSLPSSMALKGALLFELGKSEFAIPLSYTDAVIQINKSEIHKVSKGLVATHLNKNISIVFLHDLFMYDTIDAISQNGTFHHSFDKLVGNPKLYIVIVSYGNRVVGFVVDKLLQQKEIVEKPLSKPLDFVRFISGATILGNGNVCLVLDVPSIISLIFKNSRF